jgi:hypothetical protein
MLVCKFTGIVGTVMYTKVHLWRNITEFFLKRKTFPKKLVDKMKGKDKKKREKIVFLFFFLNCVFRQIMWKQFRARYGKHDKIIRNMNSACCFYKTSHTQSEYIKHIALYVKNIYSTVPQYNGYTFVAPLVLCSCLQIMLLICVYLNFHTQ